MRFLHGFDTVEITGFDADTTVLEWLREERGQPGTKEGCASGDCGACTVVVVRPGEDGTLRYSAVNACIATLGSLHGCQLISVENLRDGESLHPVQQAMVDLHGSQCGFCTPGFVMSLFALYHDSGATSPSREQVLEALGGNLCRCTGYRPIVEAALASCAAPPRDRFSAAAETTYAALGDIAGAAAAAGTYHRPTSAAAVAELLAREPQARLIAGGTDLLLDVTQGLQTLPVLIDVTAAPDLAEIHVDAAAIRLGAAVTHRAAQAAVLTDYPELTELIERFGSLQIRSRGTVVGNLANASPIGDWPPVLLALASRLELMSARGTRDLAIEDFFLDYRRTALAQGEFIRAAILPRRDPTLFLRAWKISKRYEDDISSVCGVFALQREGDRITGARVAFGGMAAIPKRARACEQALEGQRLDDHTLERAASALGEDFQPISDARASADYRARVAANLLTRLRHEWQGDADTRTHAVHPPEAAHG
jgi:xanthine dehydrogenase small subunit